MSLRLANVSKRFSDRWVLRDVSLEVARGEIFGLLGPDGDGKTALLEIIAGGADGGGRDGRIFFEDRDVTSAAAGKGFCLVSSEETASWKDVLFKAGAGKKRGSGYDRRKEAFESGLARAENVLLLDHPFCVYDSGERDDALARLRAAAREKNLAVVLATSEPGEAFAVCDRLGVLLGGRLAQVGAPRELYEKPSGRGVARAVGRINFIEARRVSFNNQPVQEFQALAGGHRLRIGKTEKNSLGAITDHVTLAIRPEHISISTGASFPEDNLLKAKIAGVLYQGATTRLTLDAGGLLLEALVLRLVGLNVGDECMVGLPPDRIMVLRD